LSVVGEKFDLRQAYTLNIKLWSTLPPVVKFPSFIVS